MYAPQGVSLSAYTVCHKMLSKNPHARIAPFQMYTVKWAILRRAIAVAILKSPIPPLQKGGKSENCIALKRG